MLKDIKFLINNIIYNNNESWKFKLLSQWDFIVGNLNDRIRLESINGSTLIVGVYNYQWMQEFFAMQSYILSNINSHLDGYYIKRLKFKLVETNQPKFCYLKFNPIKGQNIADIKFPIENILDNISDDLLKKELSNYIKKCYFNIRS